MKTIALDIGDVWTGSALSDALGITARPYKTVTTKELFQFLDQTIAQEKIGTILVGYPKTLKGTESEQTKKTVAVFETIQEKYSTLECRLWDERLTSKQAAKLKKQKTKEDKIMSHSIAAALLLMGYLEFKNLQ